MSLTRQQVETLLQPIRSKRVLHDNKGMAHVSQQDIRAHLTRMFGFGGWSTQVLALDLVREAPGIGKDGKDKGWAVTYRCLLRLSINDPQGQHVASYEDVATGTSPNLPTLGDAHDFACKVAVSMALKRAASNLGDGFGLSLYNKGQLAPLVIATLVVPGAEGQDVGDQVPEQVSMGHDDAGSVDADRQAEADRDVQVERPRKPSKPAERVKTAPEDEFSAATVEDAPPPPPESRVTDQKWFDGWLERVIKCDTLPILKGLWSECAEQHRIGKLTNADFEQATDAKNTQKAEIERRAAEKAGGWPDVAKVGGEAA